MNPPEINEPLSWAEDRGLEADALIRNKNQLLQSDPVRKTLFDPYIFNLFVHPSEIIEVRIIGVNGKKGMVYSGYFDDHSEFCKAVLEMDKQLHAGIYFTLQVIDPRLLARAFNRLKLSDLTTSDRDVLFYRWLPVDIDPVRPAGVSSSDSELKSALELREPVSTWVIQEFGFSEPIKAMSGNGGHLLFRLPDWPVNEENKQIIKGMLEEISSRFSTPQVKIDTTVYNPGRIWKLYGTTARKGDEIQASSYHEARPYRMAFIHDLGGAV